MDILGEVLTKGRSTGVEDSSLLAVDSFDKHLAL
jgi:hypothetical protein